MLKVIINGHRQVAKTYGNHLDHLSGENSSIGHVRCVEYYLNIYLRLLKVLFAVFIFQILVSKLVCVFGLYYFFFGLCVAGCRRLLHLDKSEKTAKITTDHVITPYLIPRRAENSLKIADIRYILNLLQKLNMYSF